MAGDEKRFKSAFDSLHALAYFAPEVDAALTGAGLRPGRMPYFAGRSAAMGAVGPEVVAATFYNFNPEVVARVIPRAWTLATPEQVLSARLDGVDRALTRLLGDHVKSDDVAEAADLAREATTGCSGEGRPLYAAHAGLGWPDQPHLVLWHAITLLREHRGDGHIAALVLNGLSGIEALVTHVATARGFTTATAKLTRGWSDEQWAAAEAGLADRGLLAPGDGLAEERGLTEEGVAVRDRVEIATEAAARGPWEHLGPERTSRLEELCRGLSRRVVEAGAFPDGVFNRRRT
ncbi:SCO6745 family protein [Amycolatopsis sp. cmx-4-68]|uniref:SCO6745 family protein n=1 Tax=Amycolatopsis sp. cmx-4-68 TaxID=2790938 RepID=UPI00397E1992